MKVGILTFSDTTNFGASLQAWAMRLLVQELGHKANVINYRQEKASQYYWHQTYACNKRNWRGLVCLGKFRAFGYRKLGWRTPPIRTAEKLFNHLQRYDAVIVGSDEVWKINNLRPYDPAFFLDGPGDFKRIAFAASAGSETEWSTHKPEIATALRNFDAIAARDTHTAKMVADAAGDEPAVVPDPTLLTNLPPERGAETGLGNGKIVLYGNFSQEEQQQIKIYADSVDKPIVSLGIGNWSARPQVELAIGPIDWLRWVMSADLVITHFFHGSIFGLKSGVPTLIRHDQRRAYKLASLKPLFGNSFDFIDSFHDLSIPPKTPVSPNLGIIESARRQLTEILGTAGL